MQRQIPIVDGVYWVGVNDRRTTLFESIWPIPQGVSYNSYLILDEKTVLVDTVKDYFAPEYLQKVADLLGDRPLDYLVINHMEPDHSGSITMLRQVYPQVRIIGNKKTAEYLADLYRIEDNVQTVCDGDSISLGARKLCFYLTPMVHWPETMMTFEPTSGILFSGDAFGSFKALDGGIFDDEINVTTLEDEMLRYFSNIVGQYSPMVLKAISKLSGVQLKIIAATHGPIWRQDPGHVVGLYEKWSRHQADLGVVVAFGSMYGRTESMAEAVARGLAEGGIETIRMHNVSVSHPSYVIRDAWRYRGLIIGSPTYDAGLFPPMETLLSLLKTKRLADRAVGIFSSHGWAGGAVPAMKAFVETTKLDLIEPVIDAKFRATSEQIEQCHQLGRRMADQVQQAAQ